MQEMFSLISLAVWLAYLLKLHADYKAGESPESFRHDLEYRCKDGSTVWTDDDWFKRIDSRCMRPSRVVVTSCV